MTTKVNTFIHCWAKMPDMVGIAQACPTMAEATAARLAAALARTGALAPDPARRDALAAKRDRLLALA